MLTFELTVVKYTVENVFWMVETHVRYVMYEM